MTMAVAYSIQETNKYDTSRMNTKLKIIGEKLGVEFKAQSSSNTRTVNNSYFTNAKPTNTQNSQGYNGPNTTAYESGTLDDLD